MWTYYTTNPCSSGVCINGRELADADAAGLEAQIKIITFVTNDDPVVAAAHNIPMSLPFWSDGKKFYKNAKDLIKSVKIKTSPKEDVQKSEGDGSAETAEKTK